MTINDNTFQMLINMKIWCSKSIHFNDPFEHEFKLIDDFTYDEFKKFIILMYQPKTLEEEQIIIEKYGNILKYKQACDNAKTVKQLNIKNFQQKGIFSLSEDSSNLLMWAHYANNHKGICIEFERSLKSPLGMPRYTNKVKYSKNLIEHHYFDALKKETNADEILLTKSIHWAYEKEWRLIVENGDEEYPMPKITGIIFGLKTPKRHIESIYNLLEKHKDINFFQMTMDNDEYKLVKNMHNINRIPWSKHRPDMFA